MGSAAEAPPEADEARRQKGSGPVFMARRVWKPAAATWTQVRVLYRAPSKKPCIHQGYGAFVILTKKGCSTRPTKRPKQAEKLQKSPVQKKGCTGVFVISRRRCDGGGGGRGRLGRTESSAPTDGLPQPFTIHPGGAGIAPSSVSFADTFSPRRRRGGYLFPFAI